MGWQRRYSILTRRFLWLLGHLALLLGAMLFTRWLLFVVVSGRLPWEAHLARWFSLPYGLWLLGLPLLLCGLLLTWEHWRRGGRGPLLALLSGVWLQFFFPWLGDRLARWPLHYHLGL